MSPWGVCLHWKVLTPLSCWFTWTPEEGGCLHLSWERKPIRWLFGAVVAASPKPRSLCAFHAVVLLVWLSSSWSSMAASLHSSRKHSRQQEGGRRRLIALPLQSLPEMPTYFCLHLVGQNVAPCHDWMEKRQTFNLPDVYIPPRINVRFCGGRE